MSSVIHENIGKIFLIDWEESSYFFQKKHRFVISKMSSNSNEYFKVQSNVTGWDGCTKLFIFCKKKIENKGDVDCIELLCFLILLIRSCLKRLTRKTMARFTSGLPSHLQVQDYFVTFITLLTFRCVWRCLGPAFEIATFFLGRLFSSSGLSMMMWITIWRWYFVCI